jgi:hypothetical protein
MAARLNPHQTERAKEAIQTTQLCKRLNAFALSELDAQTGKPVEMSPAQVKAAVALLKKTLPDLQSIEGGLDLHHHKHEEAIKELE